MELMENIETQLAKVGEIAEKIITLFDEIEDQNNIIRDIKAGQRDMIDVFCEQNEEFTKKQIKAGFKYYSKALNDRNEANEAELERERIIALIESQI